MAAWPSDLPKRPSEGGWTVRKVPATVRNQPERGPPMARRRASVEVEVFEGTMVLNKKQVHSLETFWRTTTSFGSAQFTMAHWIDLEDEITVIFGADPVYTHIARDYWAVPVVFHRIPD